jgi:formylglycine-generating enzyme required for sulfatase activity
LAAAKAASLAASQAESSLDQVKLALQRSRELTSADLPKLVREADESRDVADQNSKEASRALVEFEAAASEVPKLVVRLSTNTANRAILELGTNTAAAIRENLKQGKAMVAKIAEAVEATARGHQNANEAFVSSLVFLVNELADSVEINAKTAKGLADSLSNTNLSVADAEQVLDRVEAVRQMVELESITFGRIKLQLNNKGASNSDPRVEKAILLARDANFKAAERLVEITASAVKIALNEIKKESNKFTPENSTNLIMVTKFAGEQQQRLEGIKAMRINAEKRLRFAGYSDMDRLINGIALVGGEAGEIVSKANEMVLMIIQKRLPHVVENASMEWSKIEKETRTSALEDSKERLKILLDEQNQLNGIAEIYQSKEGVQNQTKEMLRSAMGKVQALIDSINVRVKEIRAAEDKMAAELREKFEEARSTSEPGKRFVIGFAVRWLPPGSFNMGSPSSEEFRDLDETPHQVVFSKGFFISETECTQAQWELVMGRNPSAIKGTNRPVEKVSWYDAVAYCQKLTEKHRQDGILPEGWIWRLPTEAEWEYAARAGTTGVRYGDLDNIAWHSGNSGEMTHEVKLKQANAFGLYDMIGNVMEWCSDWYGPYPTGVLVAPTGPISGSERVFRGGSWGNDHRISRSADRNGFLPDRSYFDLGFRPVLSPVR